MADENISIGITAHENVTPTARRVVSALDSMGDSATKQDPKLEALEQALEGAEDAAADLAARMKIAEASIKRMGNEALKSAAKIEALEKKLNSLNRAGTLGNGRNGGGVFGGLTGQLKGPSGFLKLIMIPTILDAVGAVTTLGSAATAAGAAGIAGLAPLTGLAAGIPILYSTIGQAFGVFKMASEGLKKSFENLQKPYEEMQKAVTEKLTPGMDDLSESVERLMPTVQKAMVGTSKVISQTASNLGNYFDEARTKAQLGSVMGNNNQILGSMGSAAISGIRSLMDVMVAAGPMVARLASDFSGFMSSIARWTGSNGGAMSSFFESTYSVVQQVLDVVRDLSVALFNIFKQGAELGGEMGQVIQDLASDFRSWTESVEGQESIGDWFERSKPIIWEVGRLIADIAKALGTLSMDGTVLNTLQTLRTDALPAIVQMAQAASGQFLPALAQILGAIAQIMTDLKIGPAVLQTIAGALRIISDIIAGLPGPIKELLGYLVTMGAFVKLGGFLGILSGGGKGGAIGGLFSKLAGAGTGLIQILRGVQAGLVTVGQAASAALAVVSRFLIIAAAIGAGIHLIQGFTMSQELYDAAEAAGALNAELEKTFTFEGWKEQQAQLAEMKEEYTALGELTDPKTAWTGVQTMAHYAKAAITGLWDSNAAAAMFAEGPETVQAALEEQILAAERTQQQYNSMLQSVANDVFNQGKPSWLQQSFTEGSTEMEQVAKWAEAAGVNAGTGFEEARAKITAYYNAVVAADPATAQFYESLQTLGDAASTSAQKVDAFASALDALTSALQGGDKRDAAVRVAQGWKQLSDAAEGANISMKNGHVQFRAAAQDNWALHGALSSQADAMNDVAVATYKQTGSISKATSAYENYYNRMVSNVQRSTGLAKSAAQELVNQYALTPDMVRTVFSTPGVEQAIEAGISVKNILEYIDGDTVMPKVDPSQLEMLKSIFGDLTNGTNAPVTPTLEGDPAALVASQLPPGGVPLPITPQMAGNIQSALGSSWTGLGAGMNIPITPVAAPGSGGPIPGIPTEQTVKIKAPPPPPVTIQVNKGQIQAAQNSMSNLRGAARIPPVVVRVQTGQVTNAIETVQNLRSKVSGIPQGNARVNYNQVDAAIRRVQVLKQQLNQLSSINATPSVTVSGLDSALSGARSLASAIANLQDKTITVTTVYKTEGKVPEFAGGPVVPRQTYQVGELGPELYISRGGRSEMIGTRGQETRTFPMPGKIIPNHELPQRLLVNSAAGVNSGDLREFASAVAGHTATPTRRRSSHEYMAPAQNVVNIGTINAKHDIDISGAVQRGIAEAERNRRERT